VNEAFMRRKEMKGELVKLIEMHLDSAFTEKAV
jgi:hypothetical protein